MEPGPVLSRITIFPIKSLDGIELDTAVVSEGGCLLHDRELALTDAEGNPLIGKTNPRVHELRSRVDFATSEVSFAENGSEGWKTFRIPSERDALQAWLSDFFGFSVVMRQNRTGRFLDIPDLSGATVISAETLASVAEWYPDIGLPGIRRRFRATLELSGAPAFWEDRLFAGKDQAVAYRIGEVTLFGMGPRARCIVPTRDPESGLAYPGFARTFNRRREGARPPWSRLDEYGNAYFLTVDSLIQASEIGKTLRVGDPVEIFGVRDRGPLLP